MTGITWVGNVFDKFEAMCLEVEEIILEDTVKYVENQVHTVGDGMKTFYSDVIQDLLTSSGDPVEEPVSDAPVEPNTDVGVQVKPKVGFRKKHGEVDDMEKLAENKKRIADHNLDHRPASHELCHIDNLPLAPGRCSRRRQTKKSNDDTTRNSGCIDQSPKETLDECFIRSTSILEKKPVEDDHIRQIPGYSKISAANDTSKSYRTVKQFPSEPSKPLPSETHVNITASRCESSNDNHQASCDQEATNAIARAVDSAVCASIEENKNESNDADMSIFSIRKPLSVVINISESSRSNRMDTEVSSCGSSLHESNDACLNNEMVSLVDSASNRSTQRIKFFDEGYLGRSDDHDTDVSKGDIAGGLEVENTQQVEEISLEETCVVVNVDELHFVPRSEGKSKPYKNIRNVFSSRKRSMREKEYEQLAEWCSSSGAEVTEAVHVNSSMPNTRTEMGPSSHDLCESEWELL